MTKEERKQLSKDLSELLSKIDACYGKEIESRENEIKEKFYQFWKANYNHFRYYNGEIRRCKEQGKEVGDYLEHFSKEYFDKMQCIIELYQFVFENEVFNEYFWEGCNTKDATFVSPQENADYMSNLDSQWTDRQYEEKRKEGEENA